MQQHVSKRQLAVLFTANADAQRLGEELASTMSTDRQRITELERDLSDVYAGLDEIADHANKLMRQRDQYAFEKRSWRAAALTAAAFLAAVLAITALSGLWRWE